ncbi:MAG: alpha-L-glutamate ligase-like protein [Gammaproteobacteria bacterium]|nr:alpha-L-glutamate ligase-like protein [Gammaproteobacteria bacterium]
MIGFISPKELRRHGVLGINQRNTDYIMRFNPRHLYPLVDDKLTTKSLAISAGIEVPKLYSTIEINNEINTLDMHLEKHHEVVIKPAHGSGGNGILVLGGKIGKFHKTASGDLISLNSIKHYVSNILSGMYSLGGLSDKAFLEYRVQFDPVFENISFKGVPDIRIIVFQGVPVSAMIRLPTSKSGGKANLHQGAIGVGINLATGRTTHAVIGNSPTNIHPDTGNVIHDLQIPKWQKILTIAINCADTVGLGYLGVDIVLDSNLGPLMLELNARPGLNVQLANQQGLYNNLAKIEKLEKIPQSIEERIMLAETL